MSGWGSWLGGVVKKVQTTLAQPPPPNPNAELRSLAARLPHDESTAPSALTSALWSTMRNIKEVVASTTLQDVSDFVKDVSKTATSAMQFVGETTFNALTKDGQRRLNVAGHLTRSRDEALAGALEGLLAEGGGPQLAAELARLADRCDFGPRAKASRPALPPDVSAIPRPTVVAFLALLGRLTVGASGRPAEADEAAPSGDSAPEAPLSDQGPPRPLDALAATAPTRAAYDGVVARYTAALHEILARPESDPAAPPRAAEGWEDDDDWEPSPAPSSSAPTPAAAPAAPAAATKGLSERRAEGLVEAIRASSAALQGLCAQGLAELVLAALRKAGIPGSAFPTAPPPPRPKRPAHPHRRPIQPIPTAAPSSPAAGQAPSAPVANPDAPTPTEAAPLSQEAPQTQEAPSASAPQQPLTPAASPEQPTATPVAAEGPTPAAAGPEQPAPAVPAPPQVRTGRRKGRPAQAAAGEAANPPSAAAPQELPQQAPAFTPAAPEEVPQQQDQAPAPAPVAPLALAPAPEANPEAAADMSAVGPACAHEAPSAPETPTGRSTRSEDEEAFRDCREDAEAAPLLPAPQPTRPASPPAATAAPQQQQQQQECAAPRPPMEPLCPWEALLFEMADLLEGAAAASLRQVCGPLLAAAPQATAAPTSAAPEASGLEAGALAAAIDPALLQDLRAEADRMQRQMGADKGRLHRHPPGFRPLPGPLSLLSPLPLAVQPLAVQPLAVQPLAVQPNPCAVLWKQNRERQG
ncbi:hypothetical protein PAPYR_6135 [Paratrimastix pyriformis]|uniref:Uncharacterized protein n=1 Tax=Paratrimastix pyriformis TaxID=342808 RepID=A0ABQ8UN62_9EUKA|nr:hypothetical protein PAPYR_6135 [Paratrimastix pyriformis]